MTHEHFDVLVVGAGLSGIGAGYHLQTRCPGRTYAILEVCLQRIQFLVQIPSVKKSC